MQVHKILQIFLITMREVLHRPAVLHMLKKDRVAHDCELKPNAMAGASEGLERYYRPYIFESAQRITIAETILRSE